MYLSKIEILGFKSFAQKVSIAFDSGITSIVGPNGCGKTNVVDAIRWALGEQRPTTLRSDKMEDVIFNGTKARKPLSMAEVSLTIENTKDILPTEYSEVTITRRVYRSGESEYYLNQTLCRLKDIRDLFMDTGMGSDAYSVIELKMVETILSDRADERRRLFEEAAGVTKYKHRRKEAYRRLESVQQDLTRVSDIVREVQKAVNSLERQAQKAEKYNLYAKELHGLELNLIKREYASVATKITPLREQLAVAVDEKNKIDVELQQEEALLDVLRTELNELEARIGEAQTALTRQQEIVHQHEQAIATSRERSRSLSGNIDRYEKEKVGLTQRQQQLEQHREEFRRKTGETAERVAAAEQEYERRKKELDEFERQVNAKKAELKGYQDNVIGFLHEISKQRQKESEAKARSENLRGRIEFIGEENVSLKQEIEQNSALVTELTAEDRELRKKLAAAEVRVHELEDARQRQTAEVDTLRERDFELRSSLERAKARLDFLKSLVESHGGVPEGATFLMGKDEWRPTVHSTVGEALSVDPRYRVALEAALGEAAGYVIVENIETAYRAIEVLRKEEKGKATFLCLDRIAAPADVHARISGPEVFGWAAELVGCEARMKPLFQMLLDGTLVVDGVEAARSIAAANASVRCVTLEGEVFSGSGLVRGGSRRKDEGGYVARREQVKELEEEIKRVSSERTALLRDLERHTTELSAMDVRKMADDAREIEQQTTTVEVRIAQLEFEKKRAGESIERGLVERAKLEQEIALLNEELRTAAPLLESLERKKSEAERLSGAAMSEVETMETLLSEYARAANEANVQVLSLKAEERSIAQEIEHAESSLRTVADTFAQRTNDIASAREEITTLKSRIEEHETALGNAREQGERLKEEKKGIDTEHGAKRTQVHTIELKLKDERLKHEGSLKAAHDLEFKIQELTMKAETLKGRAAEEFDLEMEVEVFEDNETFDFTAAREEVRGLKEKLRALGAVNFAAFDEYKSEKERLDFVNAQKSDLEESERTLLATIEEINTTAQQKFLGTFEQIRENFISTFKGLFDEGDECDLRLEEGVDPLEARIEITAKPRGKRPTSIDLLSGGEKTLTAIALLFAIYLVKPSPFCILDEVDAPLDDSNIDRFTRILRRFSDNTQFIVVTHNKRTMEAANALYGVTMEEEGISKLVSVRFDEPVSS